LRCAVPQLCQWFSGGGGDWKHVERHYILWKTLSVIRTETWCRTPGIYTYVRLPTSWSRQNLLGKFRACTRVYRYIPTRVSMIDRKPDVPTSRWPRSRYYIISATYMFTVLGVLAEFFFLFVPRKSYERIRISGKLKKFF